MDEEMIVAKTEEPIESNNKKRAIITVIVLAAIAVVAVVLVLIASNTQTGKYYKWTYRYSYVTGEYTWERDEKDYIDLKMNNKWHGSAEEFGGLERDGSYKIENGEIYLNRTMFGATGKYMEGVFFGDGFYDKDYIYFYFKEGYTPSKSPEEYRKSTSN